MQSPCCWMSASVDVEVLEQFGSRSALAVGTGDGAARPAALSEDRRMHVRGDAARLKCSIR